MPVQFLTEADHARLNRFPEEIPTEDYFTFFLLSQEDLIEVDKQRSNSNRLGFALQLCALRYMGFIPHELKSIPARPSNSNGTIWRLGSQKPWLA